jgi:hypothetical protein
MRKVAVHMWNFRIFFNFLSLVFSFRKILQAFRFSFVFFCCFSDDTSLSTPDYVRQLFLAFFTNPDNLEKYFKLNW